MREKGGWMFPGKHWLLGKGRKRDMAGGRASFQTRKELPTYLRFPYISSRGGRKGGIMVGEGGWFFRPYARAQRIAGKYISIQGEIRCWTGREIYYTVVDIALTRHGDDGLPRADLLLEPSLSLGDGDAAADEAGRHQVQHVVPAHREVELAGPALERETEINYLCGGEMCVIFAPCVMIFCSTVGRREKSQVSPPKPSFHHAHRRRKNYFCDSFFPMSHFRKKKPTTP